MASVLLRSISRSASLHKQNKNSSKAVVTFRKLHLNSNCSSFNDLDHVVNLKAKFERLKFELTFLCSERHVHHENDRGSKSD